MSWLTREIIRTRRGSLSSRLALLALGGTLLTSLATFSPTRLGVVSGHSMEPTLWSGRPFLYRREKPSEMQFRPGDVVVVRLGGDICVKRIFRVGGDRFWTVRTSPGPDEQGLWPVDTEPAIEKWRERFPRFEFNRYTVPPGTLFVLGDSPWSCDSRQLGPVPVKDVIGRVVAPTTPLPEIKPYPCWTARPHRPVRRAGRRVASDA